MKKLGRFERSEDGQTWTEVDLETMRRRLANAYRDVQPVIDSMVEGQTARTAYAFYRFNSQPA